MLDASPIITFTVLLLVIFTIPPLFERSRLPGLVGLLVAGIVLGQGGLRWIDSSSETMTLLSDIGKVYLMFVAGLEIDLEQFQRTRNRSMGFGFLTFIVPLLGGILLGRLFGFGWNAAVLLGSLLASHTLLAYPIVSQFGVVANEAVTVTIGATIFTDTAALLVLAICVGIHGGQFTVGSLALLLGGLAVYTAIVLLGFNWAGREFFRRSGDEQGNQFLFILLALFLASVGAQLIGVEKIVGAFLAGLAVNNVLGSSPVKDRVEFFGSVLFIPCFFIDMGLLIDVPAFLRTLSSIGLTLAIVLTLLSTKFIAALIAKLLYRYSVPEMLTMWSLSVPQVAATLAAALVAYQTVNPAGERLINENVLNSIIVLMLVTAILGPFITARYARILSIAQTPTDLDRLGTGWQTEPTAPTGTAAMEERSPFPFTVVVPIYNPKTQYFLIEMAALVAQQANGRVVPLTVVQAPTRLNSPQLDKALEQSHKRLEQTLEVSQTFHVETAPTLRIDDDVVLEINHVSREQNASLVVIGLSRTTGLHTRLFGTLIDRILWASHCPVAIAQLLQSPTTFQRLLVPVNDLTQPTIRTVRFAQLLAAATQAQVVLLYVSDRRVPPAQVEQFTQQWSEVSATNLAVRTTLETVEDRNVARAILQAAKSFDVVILRSIGYGTVGRLTMSDITTQVVRELTRQAECSIVLLGEPHS